MKFSNEEKKLAEFIFAFRNIRVDSAEVGDVESDLKPFKNILVDNVKDQKNMEKMKELLKYINKTEYIKILEDWPIPVFPITGDHLAERNVAKGPTYAKILNDLKIIWKEELNFGTDNEAVNRLLVKLDEMK